MIAFGITGIIYKIATAHADSISMVLFVYIFATAFTTIFWLFSPDKYITIEGMKWIFLAAIFAVIGMISYISALKLGEASIVAPIRNLALVVTVALAIVLLGEGLSLTKVVGIILAITALILLSVGG